MNPYKAPTSSEAISEIGTPSRSIRVLGLFGASAIGILIGHVSGDVLLCRSFIAPRPIESLPTAILFSPFSNPLGSWGIHDCVPFAPVGVFAGAGWLFWPVYALLVLRWFRATTLGPALAVGTTLWVAQGFFSIVGKFEVIMSV